MREATQLNELNEDVIEALGIRAPKEQVTINVANNQKVQLMAATVEVGIESINGKVDTSIVVKTSDKICGGMKPTNWLEIQHQWDHLKDVPFPKLATKGVIDVLLGSNYYNLMFPMREIRGKEDEPSTSLCPLGWTAIGRIGKSEKCPQSANTGYLHTFRAQLASPAMLPTTRSKRSRSEHNSQTVLGPRNNRNYCADLRKRWYDPGREVSVEESRAVLNVQWGTV